MKYYAGIGSRSTPQDCLLLMQRCAFVLAKQGYICATGAADGADKAFAIGALEAGGTVHLHLPWPSYQQGWINTLQGKVCLLVLKQDDKVAFSSVQQFHPSANRLTQGAYKLHARNYNIIRDASFVICWTPNGKEVGGTGQGIRIARYLGKPIYNIGDPKTYDAFVERLNSYA